MSIACSISNGLQVRHKRTRDTYVVLYTGLMRVGDGDWVPAVSYVPQDRTNPRRFFTRDEESFRKNFEVA